MISVLSFCCLCLLLLVARNAILIANMQCDLEWLQMELARQRVSRVDQIRREIYNEIGNDN